MQQGSDCENFSDGDGLDPDAVASWFSEPGDEAEAVVEVFGVASPPENPEAIVGGLPGIRSQINLYNQMRKNMGEGMGRSRFF